MKGRRCQEPCRFLTFSWWRRKLRPREGWAPAPGHTDGLLRRSAFLLAPPSVSHPLPYHRRGSGLGKGARWEFTGLDPPCPSGNASSWATGWPAAPWRTVYFCSRKTLPPPRPPNRRSLGTRGVPGPVPAPSQPRGDRTPPSRAAPSWLGRRHPQGPQPCSGRGRRPGTARGCCPAWLPGGCRRASGGSFQLPRFPDRCGRGSGEHASLRASRLLGHVLLYVTGPVTHAL